MSTQVPIYKLLDNSYEFPEPQDALDDGLLAWGGDLCSQRVIQAYKNGIFPWYNEGDPILWWSPNPRLLLFPKDFKISKSLKKSRKKFTIKFNENFEEVIFTCKQIREDTWISEDMLKAYKSLHVKGYAKSVECYRDEKLVGGLYGVVIGSVFCGESMFSRATDASKVALWALCEEMSKSGGDFIDCQLPTEHLLGLGAKEINRKDFLEKLFTCRDKKMELF